MTTYVVTPSNWNTAAFWQSISETTAGHTLDFSALGPGFTLQFDQTTGLIVLSDGATSFSVGEPGATGTDANLGGTTQLDFFTDVVGTQGEDIFVGTSSSDTVIGGNGNDTLEGNAGDDSVDGGEGDDLVLGGSGNDEVRGGLGADTLRGGDGDDQLFGGNDADNIQGDGGNDTVSGGAGNDTIDGGAGNDQLSGGGDADTFIVADNSGNDQIIGGESGDDNDRIDLSARTDGTTVEYTGLETGTVIAGSDTISFSEIEQFTLTDQDDVFDARNTSGDIFVETGSGADTVYASSGTTTITGPGSDRFIVHANAGGGFIDVDAGLGTTSAPFQAIFLGDYTSAGVTATFSGDLIGSFASDDGGILSGTFANIGALSGTALNDTMDASASNARVSLYGRDGDDSLTAGSSRDILYGNSGNDTLRGLEGNDRLYGGEGNDLIDGGDGADSIHVEDNFGNDTIIGGEGGQDTDVVDLSSVTGPVTITYTGDEAGTITDGTNTIAFSEIENLILTDADDIVDASADTSGANIDARGGNDAIVGGDGDDTISGGTGNDTISGGAGNDTFEYSAGDGSDTIVDFNFGNTGALGDGDNTNNDFVDLSAFYNSLTDVRGDFEDDGILNQSNSTVSGGTVDYSGKSQFAPGEGLTFQGASRESFRADNTGVICFTSGTAIRTPRGNVLIDDLRIGDLVTTMDNGPQRIRWIGTRFFGQQSLAANPNLRPVLIKQGVFGVARDLLVSPQHGILIGADHLARATHLAETTKGVRILDGKQNVTYIHLMFEAHQVIFSENIPSESFYPGQMALKMMDRTARAEVLAMLPKLGVAQTKDDVAHIFGAQARRFLAKRDVSAELA